jgi:hypothetical protein
VSRHSLSANAHERSPRDRDPKPLEPNGGGVCSNRVAPLREERMEKWLGYALDYIPRWIEFQARMLQQPGCIIAIGHRGKPVMELAFGSANLATGEALTPRHRLPFRSPRVYRKQLRRCAVVEPIQVTLASASWIVCAPSRPPLEHPEATNGSLGF